MILMRIRAILGFIFLCFGMIILTTISFKPILSIAIFYYLGFIGTYLWMSQKYFERHGLKDAKYATPEQEGHLNKMFLSCLTGWWKMWFETK